MGRNRKKDKGLPPRVYIDYGRQRKNGTWPRPKYNYKPLAGEQIFLGNTELEMYRNHLKLQEKQCDTKTMGDLINRYMQEIAIQKAPRTYKKNIYQSRYLMAFFKELLPDEVTPQIIYKYMDIRKEKGIVAANGDRALLSNVFSYAVRWGACKDNPCRLVKAFPESHRTRYPEDWEFQAVYNEGSDILKCIIDFGYLTGQRIGDILKLQESQIDANGIKFHPSKTRKKSNVKLHMDWSEALKECVDRARRLRGNLRSMTLFCKEDGQPYRYFGFRSMWVRAIDKALAKGTLKEKFVYHDIRAKNYSDEEDSEMKFKRAGHTDASMGRVYDRKYKKVRPLK